MLTIYGSDLSFPAIKVRLTASYLGIEHKWQTLNLREGEQKQEWFLKINPIGKVPAIDDNGFHLFESNACCKYLAEKNNSPIYPKDLKQRIIIDQWIDFVTVHIGVHMSSVVFGRIFAPRMNRPVNQQNVDDAVKFLDTYFVIIEKLLSEHAYIVGKQLTLVDIVLFSMLEPAEMAGISLEAYPKLNAWHKALKAESFYTKCYQEYGAALKK